MSYFHCGWGAVDLAAVELDWIEKNHPHSLQILDIYHALQYAWDFVKLAIVASIDELRTVWETNVFGTLANTQVLLPLLRHQN